jgi:hypothetical protein
MFPERAVSASGIARTATRILIAMPPRMMSSATVAIVETNPPAAHRVIAGSGGKTSIGIHATATVGGAISGSGKFLGNPITGLSPGPMEVNGCPARSRSAAAR